MAWPGHAAALPLLSLLVFLGVWQLAAASGHLERDVRAVPEHGLAGVPRRVDHPRRARGYQGYLLWEHLYMTLRRVLAGVVIGVVARCRCSAW